MTVPGEGAPQRPDDELIAADEQRRADAVDQQAEVAAILAASQARLGPWELPIDRALKVSTAVVAEYGARANSGTTNDVELDAEDGVPVVSDADFILAGLRPSTVIVKVEKNELSLKDPRGWWKRYLSYADETPLKYGWTVAERQVTGATETAEAVAEGGGRLDGLLADLDGPTTTAKAKVEIDGIDEEDDAIPYDKDAIVERVIVVNGTKNALLLVKGKRGELDKAFEEGKDAPTRIASIKVPTADKGNKKSTAAAAKAEEGLDEYVTKNNFADVKVSAISKEAIAAGEVDLEDPAEMAELVFDGLCSLLERVQASRVDRGVLAPEARQK